MKKNRGRFIRESNCKEIVEKMLKEDLAEKAKKEAEKSKLPVASQEAVPAENE